MTATANNLLEQMYASIGTNPHAAHKDDSIARIEIHHNRVLGLHLVPGLEVAADETKDGINAKITVLKGMKIEKPVQVCFGMVPESGLQVINLLIDIQDDASAGIMAHCTFPNAVDVRHEMEAKINVGKNAHYAYFERHVHGGKGGVTVVPHSKVRVAEGANYRTDFELISGRVGKMDIDVDVTCEARSVTEIAARIAGREDDIVDIRETAHLMGEHARGVLSTSIALRQKAKASIYNTLTASAPYARGHVDCKEIVQDEAVAKAVPIVEVNNPKAHVTHEAAIGSVDNKQLETLLSRGLDEDEAVDLIIQGLLGRK